MNGGRAVRVTQGKYSYVRDTSELADGNPALVRDAMDASEVRVKFCKHSGCKQKQTNFETKTVKHEAF